MYWSARFAVVNSESVSKHLVECGVADGTTMHFALDATAEHGSRAFLYDAWAAMEERYLVSSETSLAGAYASLNMENTRRSLKEFSERLAWNKGFIPDVFAVAQNPDSLAWLHLDVNSVRPTIAALDFFHHRLAQGGVILFDDFGWRGYEDTRIVVRTWCQGKNGCLLPLPTGQAIFKC